MKRTTLVLILLSLACATVLITASQAPDALQQRIARIEAHLVPGIIVRGAPLPPTGIADRMRVHDVPGVSIAVINGGKIEWARGYGLRDASRGDAVTPHTRFQAASISKPVAAMAALAFVQQGRLSLDEDVNGKLKSWKVPGNDFTKQEKVTLRRLLSHTAGLTVHGFPGYASTAPLPSLVQVLDGAKPANTAAIRVDLLPGSEHRYSGGGYTVVQQLLGDVAGKPFPQIMKETVLEPLGMSESTYEQPLPSMPRPHAATAHGLTGAAIDGLYHTYPEMAAAGLWTTPSDLARFAIAVQQAAAGKTGGVLSPAMVREMLTVQKNSYGLGLSIEGSGATARFGHGGANAGFRCQMTAYLNGGQGAVVMTNGDNGSLVINELLRAVAAEYGWPGYPGPREKTIAQVDPAIYKAYAGVYVIGPGDTVIAQEKAGKLIVIYRMQSTELLPESPTRFFELGNNSQIEFVTDAAGSVTHLVIDGWIKANRLK